MRRGFLGDHIRLRAAGRHFQVVARQRPGELPQAGYSYKVLAFRYGQKIMKPTMVTLGPGEPELNPHAGQEFDFVVSGSMKLIWSAAKSF
jgi:hypothetical protein